MDALLAGRSALAIFPTGGGKSMCYQLPALLLEGTALVISPLLALMKDQVDGLKAKGIAAARLDSTLDADQYREVMDGLLADRWKLLYISPERLGNEAFIKILKSVPLSLIAVDEAHCISEWGHNFRPDYLKLNKICRQLKVPRVLALTATATPKVETDIRKQFRIAKADVVKLSFHRENLDLRITPCTPAERKPLLLERLTSNGRPAIIYVTRQETAEEVATFLTKNGLPARAYHAGLRSELRREIQEQFMGAEIDTVVATIAFGMGVDKSNIRTVIHYNLPKSLEGYTQEIGRAGRDGAPAICEWLACAEDRTVLENFVYSDTPSPQAVRNLLDRILRLGTEFDVSVYELSTGCDIRQTVVEIILAYLETEGIITLRGRFFDTARMKPLRSFEKIFAGRRPAERKLLEGIFAELDAEWKWLTLKIGESAPRLGVPPDKLRITLGELEAAGDVVLRRSHWRQAYKIKKAHGDLRALADEMAERFKKRESNDLSRLDQVLNLSASKKCLTKTLLAHFGEKMLTDCGHCDRCRGVPPKKLKPPKPRSITPAELQQIKTLFDQNKPALSTARQLARFLCGMSSPASFRARLYRLDEYGLLADLPFQDVETLAQSLF